MMKLTRLLGWINEIASKIVKVRSIQDLVLLCMAMDVCFLGVPNLLVGSVNHVKNEGCLLEVFIMRSFNRTLSIYIVVSNTNQQPATITLTTPTYKEIMS